MRAVLNASDDSRARQSASRRRWADSAKGIGILCVVVAHSVNGLKASGILPNGTDWDFWSDWLYTFQVPIFFFVAGLFANRSYEKQGCRRFLQTKLAALAYPYIIWRTLQILIMLAVGGSTNRQVSPVQLLTFPYEPFMQFWFLYALMLVITVYALLKAARFSNGAILIVSLGMLLLPESGWYPYDALCMNMIYFAGGLVLHDRLNVLAPVRPHWLLLAATTCTVCGLLLVREGVILNTPLRPLAAIVGIAAAVLISFAGVRWKGWQPLCVLGQYSLEIYVAHSIFAGGARIALVKLFHVESLPAHVCLGIAASIAGPLLLVWLQNGSVKFRIPLFRTKLAPA